MISAEVVLDSVSPHGHRLTTFKLRYPRFIHAEFMTHRVFSRNAASSRAVPTAKLIDEADNPVTRAYPAAWGKNQGGMAADEQLTEVDAALAKAAWDDAARHAVRVARNMMLLKLHKQAANRILEPFTHISVVVTATEYMNFFGLRLDAGADPTMRVLAEAMWRAYGEADLVTHGPTPLEPGDWHLPFVTEQDAEIIKHMEPADLHRAGGLNMERGNVVTTCIKVSVARCARVSYMSHETGRRSTVEEDLRLYDRLVGSSPLHASPAEHQATPDEFIPDASIMSIYGAGSWRHPGQHGNFTGWRQYRKTLPGEALAPLPAGYGGAR